METPNLSPIQFKELPLDQRLKKALETLGFSHCTPIQAEALPLLLEHHDVAGQAQTGTGKTATFLLSTMHHLLLKPKSGEDHLPRALIISPTRELAIQIHQDAQQLAQFTDLKLALVYGGVDYKKQREQLTTGGIDILIGTPGRLIDYFKQGAFKLKWIEVLVLDEADRMFDLGFIKDVRFMLRRCPKPERRLSMLFSATLGFRVTELAYEHMNNPKLIKVKSDKITADKVEQELFHVAKEEKIPLLLGLLTKTDPTRTIIFVNTKRTAETVRAYLKGNGFDAAILSGDVPQQKRQRLFAEFSAGKLPILVATDLAARGLHIPAVSHVFNFDLPQNAEDYVHRIGRTARAGASGNAVSFACEEYVYSLIEIEEYLGHKLPVSSIETDMLIEPKPPVREVRERAVHKKKRSKSKHKGRSRSVQQS